ncbi:Magnesium-dependent phosphatase 1, partial [Clydaea vesicula]
LPEMYQLWGGGGAPFEVIGDGTKQLADRRGEKVSLLGITDEILESLSKQKDIKIAYVSTCDEPEWANDCLRKFKTKSGIAFDKLVAEDHCLIYQQNKSHHFKKLKNLNPSIKFEEMMFFDNQMNNIEAVSPLG